MQFENKWGTRSLTIKVTNLDSGRVDVHKNISRDEADWIAVSPNLKVEILDSGKRYKSKEFED